MQAIETRYFGPTNSRGARVQAKCQARTIYVSWEHALSVEENHDHAARQLATLLSWRGSWYRGAKADDTGNVYVCATRMADGKARSTDSGVRF